jgi:hypothetical protein
MRMGCDAPAAVWVGNGGSGGGCTSNGIRGGSAAEGVMLMLLVFVPLRGRAEAAFASSARDPGAAISPVSGGRSDGGGSGGGDSE